MEKPDWLKFKRYPHIGEPFSPSRDANWIIDYVTEAKNIAEHKFMPLLHKKIHQRKYRPVEGAGKNSGGKRMRTIQEPKRRPIYYASHLDSAVYSYYGNQLTAAYENLLKTKNFKNSPIAYRKIPLKGRNGNKCNIEFAYETFKFIENNKERKLSIIVSDISSFFDNLDHRILHAKWKMVLGANSLPDDHYNVYKSLIYKRYVNEVELFHRFKNNLIVERGVKNNSNKTEFKRKKVKYIWHLRKERVVAYCSKKEFFKKATDLIRIEKSCSLQHKRCRNNCHTKGIPQGTPMSATLANIYMIDFDQEVFNEIEKKNAYYQRYSDDLVIVCDQKDESFFYGLIRERVANLVKLDIQPKKTKVYRYQSENGKYTGGMVNSDDEITDSKHLEYLGFEYDGEKVKVKTVGFSKFYRGMKRSFRRGVHFASKVENKTNKLFEERLYKRFTYKGADRRMKWKADPDSETGYTRSDEHNWGNYISYLEKANKVMKDINQDDTIKLQSSKFWVNFHKEKEKSYRDINQKLSSK